MVTITDGNGQEILQTITLEDADPIVIDSNITPEVGGMDGAINTTVTGGQAPYQYEWAPSGLPATADQMNLTAGLYIVTVTDANDCSEIQSFVVDDNVRPLTIDESLTVINMLDCFGDDDGSINITVDGGVQPYSFLWSDGQVTEDAIGLGAGTYTVTITDGNNDVFTSISYVITEPAQLIVSVINREAPNAGSTDGRATASVTGGTPPYSYLWASGETTQTAVMLVDIPQLLTVTDAFGCVQTEQFTLAGEVTSLSVNVAELGDVECNGDATGFINLDVFGGVAPYTYLWSTGDETPNVGNLLPGFYSVTVSDSQASADIEMLFDIEIREPEVLDIIFEVTPPSTAQSADGAALAIVTGGILPYTYQWNNPSPNGGHREPLCENLVENTYFLVVSDGNGCTAVDSVNVVNDNQALAECLETRHIITPYEDDGLNDSFLIQCAPGTINTLEIFNRFGQQVFFMDNYDNTWEGTDRRGELLPPGGYFYVFILEDPSSGDSVPFQGHITILEQ